jgi:Xaa-Pro aminopeptidase
MKTKNSWGFYIKSPRFELERKRQVYMRSDLDTLMSKKKIDALLVTGPTQHNATMVYFTGVTHITHALLLKRRGKAPLLLHPPMERDEAANTGLMLRNFNDYPQALFLKDAGGDGDLAAALRLKKILADAGITKGTLALYGQIDLGTGWALYSKLRQAMPEINLVGFPQDELLMQAMMTKEADEIDHIRRMGKITVDVVAETADFLSSRKVKKGVLRKKNGDPLKIGDIKRKIDLWLAEQGAENPEGTIFAIGRDAGVPHSSGTADDVIRTGQTIVFDIYPCEAGGGYFYDFTRTWCMGFAPDPVLKLYEDVGAVYQKVVAGLRAGARFADSQSLACDLFQEMGHPTIREEPATERGYVHSVGHGIGLQIHEKPWSGSTATSTDKLLPGTVFTIEPGLYYPEDGMGVRIEDSYLARADGTFEILADFPKDLILPVRK